MFDRVNTHQFFRELFVPFDPVTFSVALIYDGASDVTFFARACWTFGIPT